MKKIFGYLLSVLIISFFSLLAIMAVTSFNSKTEDNRHLGAEIKTEGLRGYPQYGTPFKYMKRTGKYDDIQLDLKLESKDKSALFILPEDIIVEGIEYNPEEFVRNLRFRDVKITDPKGFRIYIPAGTVITQKGYALHEDFSIQNVKWTEQNPGIPLETKTRLLKYVFWSLLASAAIHLLGFMGGLLRKSEGRLEFDRGVFNMAICIPATVLILVLFQLFNGQFERGSYDNAVKLMMMMSIFLIPLGALVMYKILVTFVYNIAEGGLVVGVGITLLQFIAVFTVIYAAAVIAAFWVGLSTAPLRERRW